MPARTRAADGDPFKPGASSRGPQAEGLARVRGALVEGDQQEERRESVGREDDSRAASEALL